MLDYLDQEGDVRSASEISHYFERAYGTESALMACEYLADIEMIEKASTPAKLTTRSQVEVDELAFFYSREE